MGLKNTVRQKIGDMKLAFQRKWERDCRCLPLTAVHRDLYVTIQVQVPKNLTAEQKEKFQEMRKSLQ